MINEITIIVIAYNRLKSVKRLLKSLNDLNIEKNDIVNLYISIDKGNSNENIEVYEYSKKFNWKFGKKIVDYKKENMGLKEHVLCCGNLSNIYENIIVLEDDLVVSPLMISYAKQVIEYYKNDNKIAGYGLYSYQKNQYVNMPFIPINDGTDVYFMQNACSWGQIWTKEKWNEFYNWYLINKDNEYSNDRIPSAVCQWGKKSWLKWHIKYLIETDKYFVYPQVGLSTNFSDVGEHNSTNSFGYQCILYTNNKNIKFRFQPLSESNSVYDAFYENIRLNNLLKIKKNIVADVFSTKKNIDSCKDLLLTTKKRNNKIYAQYGLLMYPYEQNLINNIPGNDLIIYDLSKTIENNSQKKQFIFI